MHHIIIRDAHANGNIINEVLLEISESTITVEELIRRRVAQEAEAFDNQSDNAPIIRRQNGEGSRFAALQAFRENGFVILINNQSIQQLDQEIHLKGNTEIRFVQIPTD